MSYNIVATPDFERELKRLSRKHTSLKKDYSALLNRLELNPQLGTSLGGNCYKIRLAISSKRQGKSGGARVITFVAVVNETVYLIGVYDKSEQQTMTDKEIKERVKRTF
jgi:mRNA-degrading endonuclease RelE of RelBE toxin-antitoxin system